MLASERLSVEHGRPRRAGVWAGVVLAAASLHMALLGGWRWTWDAPPTPLLRTLQVRSLEGVRPGAPAGPGLAPPAFVAAAVETPADRTEAPADRPKAPADRPEAPAGRPAAPAGRPAAPAGRLGAPAGRLGAPAVGHEAPRLARAEPRPALAPQVAGGEVVVTSPAASAVLALSGAEPPPVYRVRLPPPLTLRYDVRRGLADGSAELRWRRDAEAYALDWQVRIADVAVLTQSSQGAIDGAGVAPLRFVDQRPSRAAAAVNFRRDIGRIAFSRKAADAALGPGAQDRLSWLLQLAGIVAAEPELRRAGAEIRLTVAGAGGDVAVWRFRCEGEDRVATDAGMAPALRFVREPGGPYETRAEVWLDAAGEHFLPLRVSWRSGPLDDGFDLRLRAAGGITAE